MQSIYAFVLIGGYLAITSGYRLARQAASCAPAWATVLHHQFATSDSASHTRAGLTDEVLTKSHGYLMGEN